MTTGAPSRLSSRANSAGSAQLTTSIPNLPSISRIRAASRRNGAATRTRSWPADSARPSSGAVIRYGAAWPERRGVERLHRHAVRHDQQFANVEVVRPVPLLHDRDAAANGTRPFVHA